MGTFLQKSKFFCFEEKSSIGQISFSGMLASMHGENVELALETAYNSLSRRQKFCADGGYRKTFLEETFNEVAK